MGIKTLFSNEHLYLNIFDLSLSAFFSPYFSLSCATHYIRSNCLSNPRPVHLFTLNVVNIYPFGLSYFCVDLQTTKQAIKLNVSWVYVLLFAAIFSSPFKAIPYLSQSFYDFFGVQLRLSLLGSCEKTTSEFVDECGIFRNLS